VCVGDSCWFSFTNLLKEKAVYAHMKGVGKLTGVCVCVYV